FCQENVLGMSGTPGMPCTAGPTVPSGQSWYRPFGSLATAPWNLTTALDTRWVRITLKGNSMTAEAANGSSGTSTQVCWDGKHQMLLPGGYGPACAPTGGLYNINLTNASVGYTSAPTVTISAPPGGGTTATAHTTGTTTVSGGIVVAINIGTGGN